MIETAYVNIWDTRVGAIAWNASTNLCSFEFESSFLNSAWDLAPLQMPLKEAKGRIFSFSELRNSPAFKGLPGLLADVLPDNYGNALINTWLTRRGRPSDSMNPVEKL